MGRKACAARELGPEIIRMARIVIFTAELVDAGQEGCAGQSGLGPGYAAVACKIASNVRGAG